MRWLCRGSTLALQVLNVCSHGPLRLRDTRLLMSSSVVYPLSPIMPWNRAHLKNDTSQMILVGAVDYRYSTVCARIASVILSHSLTLSLSFQSSHKHTTAYERNGGENAGLINTVYERFHRFLSPACRAVFASICQMTGHVALD